MKLKICSTCKIEKDIHEYGILSRSSDGHYPQCKICKKLIDDASYKKNTQKRIDYANEYYKKNKEKILQTKDREFLKEYNKLYKKNNSELISEYNKLYKIKNKDKIKKTRQLYKLNNKDKLKESDKNRLKKNPLAKLAKTLRRRLNEFLNNKGFQKKYKFEQYIGCSLEELKIHIEKQFSPGMTWENHGYGQNKWNIDHNIALSNAQNEKQIYDLSHYLNLRPMWQTDNIQKQNRSDICWQKLQRDRLLQEDIKNGMPIDLGARNFQLQFEKLSTEHRQFIERYEWLGTIGFGVRYVFTARYNGILGGVVMIAEPNSYQFDKHLEALIQRGACASWTPKNLGSKLIMFSCKWMVNNTNKRIFTAYSDPEAGEIGTIYQACNFDYLGQDFGSTFNYLLPNGKQVTTRYFTRTSAMKKWAKELQIEWQANWSKSNGFQNIKEIPIDIRKQLLDYANKQMKSLTTIKKSKKGKYVLLLKKNKRENINKTWSGLEYPKRY